MSKKTKLRERFGVFLAMIIASFLGGTSAVWLLNEDEGVWAQIEASQTAPNLLSVQGRIVDKTTGLPLTGDQDVIFTIWDMPDDVEGVATDLWSSGKNSVEVGSTFTFTDGVFSAELGRDSNNPITPAIFSMPDSYLGIKVGSDQEATPRQRIVSSAYTFQAANGVQAGMVEIFAGPQSNIPPGWHLCDGRALDSFQYPILFAAIATYWGDGSTGIDAGANTDFNLPDLRGRFLRGVDSSGEVPPRDPDIAIRDPQGTGFPEDVGSLQDSGTAHPSSGNFTAANGGGHSHSIPARTNNNLGTEAWLTRGLNDGVPGNLTTGGEADHVHSISGGDNETRPKNAYVNYIIKY